jgi:hypothetical protein
MICPSELTPRIASDIVDQVLFKLSGPRKMMELLADDDIDNADLFYMISGILEDQIEALEILSHNLLHAQAIMERANAK